MDWKSFVTPKKKSVVSAGVSCSPCRRGSEEGLRGYDCAASDQTFETLASTLELLSKSACAETAVVCPPLLNLP